MARGWKVRRNLKLKLPRINFLFLPIIIFIIASLLFVWLEHNLKPTIKSIAEAEANLIATEVINKAIYEKVLYQIDYNELVNIHKDNNDRVSLIQANSIKISQLISTTNLEIRESLKKLEHHNIEIPLGQALDSPILATYGPKVKVKAIPIGEIDVQLIQDFHEAGINQTRHILYLDVNVDIRVIVPTLTDKIRVNAKAPIAETIIVGTVPDTVVRLEGMDNIFKGSIYSGID